MRWLFICPVRRDARQFCWRARLCILDGPRRSLGKVGETRPPSLVAADAALLFQPLLRRFTLSGCKARRDSADLGIGAHLPIDGEAGSKPAPLVMNEWARFVAQASSLQPMQPGMAALRSESPSIGRCALGIVGSASGMGILPMSDSLTQTHGQMPVLCAAKSTRWAGSELNRGELLSQEEDLEGWHRRRVHSVRLINVVKLRAGRCSEYGAAPPLAAPAASW